MELLGLDRYQMLNVPAARVPWAIDNVIATVVINYDGSLYTLRYRSIESFRAEKTL